MFDDQTTFVVLGTHSWFVTYENDLHTYMWSSKMISDSCFYFPIQPLGTTGQAFHRCCWALWFRQRKLFYASRR
jgi:hypothetical protein